MNLKRLFKRWDESPMSASNFNGVWRNELNSEMSITVEESGRIFGEYRPGAAAGVSDSSHPLVGFANGDLITFSVDFEHHKMVCSWTGHAVTEQNTDVIKSQWNLVKHLDGEEFSMETWGATHCGSNSFKRVG